MSLRTECRYEVVQANNLVELTERVNGMLEVGFVCVGGPFMLGGVALICQAMLLERFA